MDEALWMGAELLVWAESNLRLAIPIVAALLVPGIVCCWAARQGAVVASTRLHRLDSRLAHLSSAVELLTDTTEEGLRSAFAEIERVSSESGARAAFRAGLPTRVRLAAGTGQAAHEIAQREGVSEGEVLLRLKLQRAAALAPAAMVQ